MNHYEPRKNTPSDALSRFHTAILAEQQRESRLESRVSLLRLAIFGGVVIAWFVLYAAPLPAIAVTTIGAMAFAVALRTHLKIKDRCEALSRLATICDEAQRRTGGAVVRVRGESRPASIGADVRWDSDPGRDECWPLTSQELDDLDVFADPVGIFGILNRCSTAAGERRLAWMLRNPLTARSRITSRQNAIRWLAENTEARLRLMGACASLRGEDKRMALLIRALHEARPLENRVPSGLLMLWSIASTVAVLFATLQSITFGANWFGIVLGVWILNGAATGGAVRKARRLIALFRETAWPTRGFAILAHEADARLRPDSPLNELHGRFSAIVAPDGIERLRRLVGWSESSGVFIWLMSLTFHYELHYARALEQCVIPRRESFLAAIAAIAELEALLSFAAFAAEQPHTCWPVIAPDLRLQLIGGRHPLIDLTRVVANDVWLDATNRVWIITGSNMAGKSTFLRMVGVNILLAQCGSAVVAEEMAWQPVRLLSDLRASDNLADGESYFLAEVRHVRRMVCAEHDERPLLGLIDEPFRGTNSQEQTAAGVAITKSLIASGNLFLLATHDRALTTLADGVVARNFHFREDVGSEGMTFDYRLRAGPAVTRNALRVLERENYPQTVLEDAHAWLERDGHRAELSEKSAE